MPRKTRKTSAKALKAMVERYEGTLRRLVDAADDEAKWYAHGRSRMSPVETTNSENARHDLYQEIRRSVAHALHEFHPDIVVE
jgi:hypothetical protein